MLWYLTRISTFCCSQCRPPWLIEPQLQGRRTAAFEFILPCSSGSILRVWIRISPSLHMHMHTKQQQAAIGVGDIGLRYHFRRQVAARFSSYFLSSTCTFLLHHFFYLNCRVEERLHLSSFLLAVQVRFCACGFAFPLHCTCTCTQNNSKLQ